MIQQMKKERRKIRTTVDCVVDVFLGLNISVKCEHIIGFGVFTAMFTNGFWDVMLCSLLDISQRFDGISCLHGR
jgi:hypothetical protein